jgi:hypothetical protein
MCSPFVIYCLLVELYTYEKTFLRHWSCAHESIPTRICGFPPKK